MYNIVSISTNIFDVIVTFMFFTNFLKWKTDNKSFRFLSGVLMFTATLISNFFIHNNIITTLVSIIIMLILTCWFDNKFTKKLFVVIGYMVLVLVADIITTLVIMKFLHTDINTLLRRSGDKRIIAMIMSKPIILCLVKIVCMFKNKDEINIYRKYWAALLTIPIVNITLLIAIINFFDNVQLTNTAPVYVSTICILYNTILIFFLMERILMIILLENRCDILENQIIIQAEQVKHNDSDNQRFASIRHDLRIHFQTLYNIIKRGYYDIAEQYIKDTGLAEDIVCDTVHTGNIAFDSILNTKLSEAEEQGVRVGIICQIPKDLQMSAIDICILFGNLLDNAIEGCQRAKNPDKQINIYIKYKSNRLICCIQNTSNNDIKKDGDNFVSEKSDKKNHGIGIYNIKDVVLKYEGVCKMQNEDNKFTAMMTLFNV